MLIVLLSWEGRGAIIGSKTKNRNPNVLVYFRPWRNWSGGCFIPEPIMFFANRKKHDFGQTQDSVPSSPLLSILIPLQICIQNTIAPGSQSEGVMWSTRLHKWNLHVNKRLAVRWVNDFRLERRPEMDFGRICFYLIHLLKSRHDTFVVFGIFSRNVEITGAW